MWVIRPLVVEPLTKNILFIESFLWKPVRGTWSNVEITEHNYAIVIHIHTYYVLWNQFLSTKMLEYERIFKIQIKWKLIHLTSVYSLVSSHNALISHLKFPRVPGMFFKYIYIYYKCIEKMFAPGSRSIHM